MNNLGECSPYGFCYFHPREVVVGVCAACLTEKLLVLASKQGHGGTAAALQVKKDAHQQYGSSSTRAFMTRVPSRKPSSISIPKVFALGSSLLHRLDSRHRRPGYDSDDGASVLSLDDSFISIKFEDNGQFSWDKKAAANINNPKPGAAKAPGLPPGQNLQPSWPAAAAGRSVVEHARPRGGGSGIRWRKRIGHLFQLVRWRRTSSNKGAGASFSGKVDGGERRGWIRSLTRRRTTE